MAGRFLSVAVGRVLPRWLLPGRLLPGYDGDQDLSLGAEPGCLSGVPGPVVLTGGLLAFADLGLDDLVDLRRGQDPPLGLPSAKPSRTAGNVRAARRRCSRTSACGPRGGPAPPYGGAAGWRGRWTAGRSAGRRSARGRSAGDGVKLAGHQEGPVMLAPRIVDNVTLTEQTDFAQLVRENLAGGGGLGSLRSDNFPLDAIFR
ncbi:MAG: hypothetical protein ABJB47_13460, partial [Actinomycetota bacterium]